MSAEMRQRSNYAELTSIVRAAGLLERRTDHYLWQIGLTFAALAAVATMFVLLGDTWWQLGTAVLLAIVWTHLAFVGHDAGHKQIFASRRANEVVGMFHGALVGLSFGWWVGKHNRHHANPNHEEEDPDLDIGVLAFTLGQTGVKRGVARWITRHQGFLFVPLLLLEGWSLHWSAISAAWAGDVRRRRLELALIAVHTAGYLTAVLLVLPPLKALVFVLVHQGLWGLYMGLSFAPNHKGMPTTTGAEEWDFLDKQVRTSRNVRAGFWTDLALGGLNHQIEHHLFPGMARPHLRRARPLVQRFCVERGIPYHETSLWRSYAEMLTHLHAVGASLRTPSAPVPSPTGSSR